jgi:hypothetical protein
VALKGVIRNINLASDWSPHLANGIFDLKGNYNDDYNVQIHDLLCLNEVHTSIYQDDYDQELSVAAAESANLVDGIKAVGNRTNLGPVKTRCKINYKALRPFFLNVKAEVVCQTITNTTQFTHNILAGPNMMKTYKSPFPTCNVCHRNEAVATNTIISQVPAVDTGGIKVTQIFVGCNTLVCDVYGLCSESQFINSLLDKAPWTSSSVTALLLRYQPKFLVYYATFKSTVGKVNPTCNIKTLQRTDGVTSNA